jgi:hypothetical protein
VQRWIHLLLASVYLTSCLIAVALAWAWAWTTVERILKNASSDLCGNRVGCNPLLSINHALSLLLVTTARATSTSPSCVGVLDRVRHSSSVPPVTQKTQHTREDTAYEVRVKERLFDRSSFFIQLFSSQKKLGQRCAGSKKIGLALFAVVRNPVRSQCLQLTASVGVCRKWSTRLLVSLHCASDLPCI